MADRSRTNGSGRGKKERSRTASGGPQARSRSGRDDTASAPADVSRRTNSFPEVGVIMGSSSDWETMHHAVAVLDDLGVRVEARVVSAHRTPDLLFEYAAAAAPRGLRVIIAGAGGAAHLPGMCASKTSLPVLGVPVQSKSLNGIDSLLSIVQMPAGIPVGTLAIGKAGAINAGLLAAAIVGQSRPEVARALDAYRAAQTARVLAEPDLLMPRAGDPPHGMPHASADARHRGGAA